MSRRVVIMQSNYIPWRGYFDLFAHADTVVLFDSVQSTKNDWRNRNAVKSAGGKRWLTIPIHHSKTLRVNEVEIADNRWHDRHFRALQQSYARAPHASELLPLFREWFLRAAACRLLSDANAVFIEAICAFLRITAERLDVRSVLSNDEHDRLEATARLVEICRRLNASSYLTAPAARAYLDVAAFADAGVAVEWFDYEGYPEYAQLHGAFDPAVSIIDLLLMTGPDARRYAIRPSATTRTSLRLERSNDDG